MRNSLQLSTTLLYFYQPRNTKHRPRPQVLALGYYQLNNIKSDLHSVSCGIPQGSVLGPLHFPLYINYLNKCSKLLHFYLFADDSNLFYKHKNLLTLQSNINMELNNIYIWLCANKLSLNIDKSNFVIFHPAQKNLIQDVKLTIN